MALRRWQAAVLCILVGVLTAFSLGVAGSRRGRACKSKKAKRAHKKARKAQVVRGVQIGFNEDMLGSDHGVTPRQKLTLVKQAGGSAVRTVFDWRAAEPQRGVWDEARWNDVANFYSGALSQGIKPIIIIGFAPDWARSPSAPGCGPGTGPGLGRCELPPAPNMDGEWAQFAARVASRFPDSIIEIWNEPNLSAFWKSGPDPARYAQLYLTARAAIKGASPGTQTLLAGLFNAPPAMAPATYLSNVFSAQPSIARIGDGISLHDYPYSTNIGRRSLWTRTLRSVRAVRDRFRSRAQIYLTEVGLATGGSTASVTPKQQAQTMTRVYKQVSRMRDVPMMLFHRLLDPSDSTADPNEIESSWLAPGAYPPAPRPVYCSFVTLLGGSYPGC